MQGLMLVVILLVRRGSYDSRLRLLSRINCFLRWSMAFIWRSSRSYLAHNSTSRNIIEHILHLENKDIVLFIYLGLSVHHHKHSLAPPI